ncbi:MAG: TIGR03087 family PEP-CTERM/XrtA system glycosyltransferase [Planctomycetota bacterium]
MPRRKNILFLTTRVPSAPDKGDKIRTFHQLEHLARRHHVYLAGFADSDRDLAAAAFLRRICADVAIVRLRKHRTLIPAAAKWIHGLPLMCGAFDNRELHRSLARWSREIDFDVGVCFSTSMAPYLLELPLRRRVLDMCDVDSEKWFDYAEHTRFPMSMLFRREGARLRAFERSCLSSFDSVIFITEQERAILNPLPRVATTHVISNGTHLHPGSRSPASSRGPVIGFLGAMHYPPNVQAMEWFVREVWPQVSSTVPGARLMIAGRNPARSVRRLSQAPAVEVIGEVSDARRFLLGCRVVVAPMQIARGLQNKVLEAMAARRPVVATLAVASCLDVVDRHNILVADEAGDFADRVAELCWYDGLCERISEAGYRYAATYHCWPEVLQTYEQVVLGGCEVPLSACPPSRNAGAPPLRLPGNRGVLSGSPVFEEGRKARSALRLASPAGEAVVR